MSKAKLRIVHVAPTPLVGAPGKIAAAQRGVGHNAVAVVLKDYPKGGPLEGKFLDNSLVADDFTARHVEEVVGQADVVHVHNDIPHDFARKLKELNQAAAYIYQVHSPLREGPLYVDRSADIGLPFRKCLVVGQYHPRHYQDFVPVPNLVLDAPSVSLRKPGEKLRVMFSPSHKAEGGRWTSKYSPELLAATEHLHKLGKIDLVFPSVPVHPSVLMEVRRGCHVSIDEIATGGFHQVSLEGLCAGNVVINRADWFCRAAFAQFCGGNLPPFVYSDGGSVADVLMRLADDAGETARLQQVSYDFFSTYCAPSRLVEVFDEVYQQVI